MFPQCLGGSPPDGLEGSGQVSFGMSCVGLSDVSSLDWADRSGEGYHRVRPHIITSCQGRMVST